MNICILGRQSKLGLAELEQRFSSERVQPIGGECALVDDDVAIDTLGGTVKTAKLLTILETANPQKAFDYCRRQLPGHAAQRPEGKIQLGVSLYGLDMPLGKLNANVLSLKKAVKQSGRSIRAIPNTALFLSSAQTYHNHLTGPMGIELAFIGSGKKIYIAQVTGVQNIDAFAARDQARPKTDAFVGMLPPKLALMMVNLSGVTSQNTKQTKSLRILDPFCGTGVVLQEASLLGFDVYGTDLSEKMVSYSRANLEWLTEKYSLNTKITLHPGDAIDTTWQPPIDAVVAETYLGQPFSAPPSAEKLAQVRRTCNEIITKFLENLAPQLQPGTPLCLAIPAWRSSNGTFTHLPVANNVTKHGYQWQPLTYASPADLLYYRENQVVTRQLLVLVKQ